MSTVGGGGGAGFGGGGGGGGRVCVVVVGVGHLDCIPGLGLMSTVILGGSCSTACVTSHVSRRAHVANDVYLF